MSLINLPGTQQIGQQIYCSFIHYIITVVYSFVLYNEAQLNCSLVVLVKCSFFKKKVRHIHILILIVFLFHLIVFFPL